MSRLNENSGKETVSISSFHLKFDTNVAKQSKRFKKE